MTNLTNGTKTNVYERIKESVVFNEFMKAGKLLDFIDSILDLKVQPSQDSRFSNAYEDYVQHMIHNDDWTIDDVFKNRFDILGNDQNFIKFIETILSPENLHNGIKEHNTLYTYIKKCLKLENLELTIADYNDEGMPIYIVTTDKDLVALPTKLKVNTIPFYLMKRGSTPAQNQNSKHKPTLVPSFILVFNDKWNDYGIHSEFYLYYYNEKGLCFNIGFTKIINEADGLNTFDQMASKFTNLDKSFCSLGQSEQFYINLLNALNEKFDSVIYAIRDAAFYSLIFEQFEQNKKFINSLVRDDKSERVLRQIKYKIKNYDMSKLYSFNYIFKPLFSESSIEVEFAFDNNSIPANRIYAIIGKNGTGKTQLITSLPIDISEKNGEKFKPQIPLFSKLIAVSYSIFDRFSIPRKTDAFNYIYCGLRNENGDFITEASLINRFHETWRKIVSIERVNKWRDILLTFLEKEIVDEFLLEVEEPTSNRNNFEVSLEGFNKIKNKLSSGQGIILYIITEIVANIRYDSLIIYDEPETHLHPNAITQLMNTIYRLVNEFQSYCIIATHSPLVIRELLSRSVYVIEKNNNVSSVRRIALESFGENLTSITEEVFGNKEVVKQSKIIIQDFIDQGKSFDEILSVLEYDDIPLSLNARILIKSLLKEKNEKS